MAKFRVNTRELESGVRRLLAANKEKIGKAMKDAGHFIRSEVQLRTPVDEGILTSGIKSEVVEHRKSYAVKIFVPANAPSAKYAVPMHEGKYKLGENSQAKQKTVSAVVGRKYITRAIEENMTEIGKVIAGRLKL
jgi:hypothetical protein